MARSETIAAGKAWVLPMEDYKFACCVSQTVGNLKGENLQVIFLSPKNPHIPLNCFPGRNLSVGVEVTCIDFKI